MEITRRTRLKQDDRRSEMADWNGKKATTGRTHSEGNRVATAMNHSEGRFRRRLWSSDSQRRLIQISFLEGFLFTTPGKGVDHAEECGFVPFPKANPQFPELFNIPRGFFLEEITIIPLIPIRLVSCLFKQ
ncbi:hypothetical protein LXL04_026963 [Taraxacum kok-saghyz]